MAMKPSYFQRATSGARRNFLQTSAGLAAAALVPVRSQPQKLHRDVPKELTQRNDPTATETIP